MLSKPCVRISTSSPPSTLIPSPNPNILKKCVNMGTLPYAFFMECYWKTIKLNFAKKINNFFLDFWFWYNNFVSIFRSEWIMDNYWVSGLKISKQKMVRKEFRVLLTAPKHAHVLWDSKKVNKSPSCQKLKPTKILNFYYKKPK